MATWLRSRVSEKRRADHLSAASRWSPAGCSLVRRAYVTGLLASATLSSLGCGAKTGLNQPDGGEENSLDASFDAGAGADAGPDAGPPPDLCIEVPLDGTPVEAELDVEAIVGSADVVFLIDTTASMGEEIDRIRSSLRDAIAPAIAEAIPDSQIGVATFGDFPIAPYGAAGRDLPFELRLPVGDDVAPVQAAVNAIDLGDGQDSPESQTEALYQLVSGEGIGEWVPPSVGCPRGGFGFACMRTDAMPVVLLFTDAPFHNGPGPVASRNAYDPELFPADAIPHGYEETLSLLRERGVRVIGFDSGEGGARDHLERLANDTSTTAAGRPLVFAIGSRGQRLSTSVVEAIRTFAGTVRQDIDAILGDPDRSDDVDPRDLVEAIEPLRAEPADGIAGIEDGAFLDAQAGTRLTWGITVRSDAICGPRPQVFRLEVLFRGDERRRLSRQSVDLVIPACDGTGCENL